jgi:hypothetical protein
LPVQNAGGVRFLDIHKIVLSLKYTLNDA